MSADSLTITDNRTGRSYDFPIEAGTLRAAYLRELTVEDDGAGLRSYDPGYKNTASAKSAITYIDGERGVLRYRGYPIEQLGKHGSFHLILPVSHDDRCTPVSSGSRPNGCAPLSAPKDFRSMRRRSALDPPICRSCAPCRSGHFAVQVVCRANA